MFNWLIECEKKGGPPFCYSGFCESIAECVDCPCAYLEKAGQNPECVVCSGAGMCKLGWKSPNSKAANGYCECDMNRKGLACNLI